jgi:hypothetical protein
VEQTAAVESKYGKGNRAPPHQYSSTSNTAAFDKVNGTAPALADTTRQSNAVKDSAQNTVVPPADSIEKAVLKDRKHSGKKKLQWHVVSRIGGSIPLHRFRCFRN